MCLSKLRILFILFLLSRPLYSAAAPPSLGEWNFITDIKLESLVWPQSYGEGTNDQLNRLQLVPTLSGKFGESIRLSFKPELFWDPENNSANERVFLNIGEASFKYRTPTSSWQIGSHILNWGVTDGYNPLDVVNPKQFYDPLRAKKIGVWSLLFSHSSENAEQELIYIPKSQSSLLPGVNSRWLPREIYIPQSPGNDVILLLPENIHFTYGDHIILDKAMDHNLGLRLQWHLGSIDLGLYAFEGLSAFPIIQPEVTGRVIQVSPATIIQTDPDIILHLKDYRQRQAGFSWVSSQYNFLLKYAASYTQSLGSDPLLPGWMHEQVLGLERNFNIGPDGLLIAILQYSYINDEKEDDSNLSVAQIFRRAWMVGGRFSWGDNWTLNVLGLYDTLHFSHLQEYGVARRLFDIWTLELSANFIAGRSDTPLGIYNQNDSYRLSLSRSF